MEFKDITSALKDVSGHYHLSRPPAFFEYLRDMLMNFLRWLNEILRDFFRTTSGNLDSRSVSSVMQFIAIFLGVAAILIAAVFLLRRASSYSRQKHSTVRGAASTQQILNAEGWRKQAHKLAAAEDYRGACRAVYLSLLQELDEHKIAPFAPTKTNYEYVYAMKSHPGLQAKFKDLALLVETIWFGNKTALADDYSASIKYLDDLDAAIIVASSAQSVDSPEIKG